MEMKEIIYEGIVINSMRAIHEKNIKEFYYEQKNKYEFTGECSGTMEDLVFLDKESKSIDKLESDFLGKTKNVDIPEWIDTKTYCEITGISRWKLYKELKNGNIIAEKVRNRWRIFIDIESIDEKIA
jgi:hypothetical protein